MLLDNAAQLKELLGAWRKALEYPELAEKSPELLGVSLGRAAYWASAHAEPLHLASELIEMAQPTIGASHLMPRSIRLVRSGLPSRTRMMLG